MSLVIGRRFGSYEVAELIGVGGTGQVVRARDVRLHRDARARFNWSALLED
jgi:hypothetical protein